MRGGVIPFHGTTIDESSGSTGTPYNWIRGEAERQDVLGFLLTASFNLLQERVQGVSETGMDGTDDP